MSHDNAALSRRWFKEVWNANREATIDELAAPDIVIHGLGEAGRPEVGIDHFKAFHRRFRSGLTDIHIEVHDVIAEGDQTATRLTMTATHSGDGFGVPATGRSVRMTAIVWARWRDGKMAEGWNEFDAAGLARQLTQSAAAAQVCVKA